MTTPQLPLSFLALAPGLEPRLRGSKPLVLTDYTTLEKDGPRRGIRTPTALILSQVPPAVGLHAEFFILFNQLRNVRREVNELNSDALFNSIDKISMPRQLSLRSSPPMSGVEFHMEPHPGLEPGTCAYKARALPVKLMGHVLRYDGPFRNHQDVCFSASRAASSSASGLDRF